MIWLKSMDFSCFYFDSSYFFKLKCMNIIHLLIERYFSSSFIFFFLLNMLFSWIQVFFAASVVYTTEQTVLAFYFYLRLLLHLSYHVKIFQYSTWAYNKDLRQQNKRKKKIKKNTVEIGCNVVFFRVLLPW